MKKICVFIASAFLFFVVGYSASNFANIKLKEYAATQNELKELKEQMNASSKNETEDALEEEDENIIEVSEEPIQEPTQEPALEPTQEPTVARLLEEYESPFLGDYLEARVIAADATSTIYQEKYGSGFNAPIKLFDHDDTTTWQEGVGGYGIGESVSFSFDKTYKVKYIAFKLGNWHTDAYYYSNAKPRSLTLAFGDFSQQVTFRNDSGKKIQWVEVNNPVNADSMRVTIDDIYAGAEYQDTCITEITVYGN